MEKLRTILLYEADFNMNNGFIGRKIMNNAEKNDVLAKEQYGSRKSHSAQVQALNKRLVFDVLRQSKKLAVLIANDAKSCYDRITINLCNLCLRHQGLNSKVSELYLQTLENMQYYPKHKKGIKLILVSWCAETMLTT